MSFVALRFWARWLQAAAGVVMALPVPAQTYIRFMHGVLGAGMMGWMTLIFVLAGSSFIAGQRTAWNTVAASVGSWFLIDTIFSALHGVWVNVVLNAATAALFAVPLVGSRKHFTAG